MIVKTRLKFLIFSILPFLTFISIIFYFFHPFCRNKFGLEFNSSRILKHIPVIPANWKIKQRDFSMIWWMGKELVIGHESKRVVFSGCEVDEEIDDYFFSLQQLQERFLQIRFKYANAKRGKDSISFMYQVGNNATFITSQQADSIFKINKIKKDY